MSLTPRTDVAIVHPAHAGPATVATDAFATIAPAAIAPVRIGERTGVGFYRPELDVLRFFAFLGVFICHNAQYPPDFFAKHHIPYAFGMFENCLARAGAYGVDLFFVLSAYLITELLLREKRQRGALDIRAFYMRRILRIWPLYFAFVALVALVPALNPNHEFGLRYVIPFLLFVGNWSVVAFGFPGASVAVPLWSVSVEEQFYLLWPPIVSRLSRRHVVYAALAMIVIANVTRAITVVLHEHDPQVWCNTFAQLDSIALGIILAAILNEDIPDVGTPLRTVLLLLGLSGLLLVARYADLSSPAVPLPWESTLIGYPVVAIGCTLIVVASLGSRSRLASSPTLLYLGKISYGLYVYHLLAGWIASHLLNMASSAFRGGMRFLLALGITILLAAVSYRYLEAPFLTLKRRFTYVPSRPV
jgi:peptidoglycan/LPS O-acetylase OafA/YrhL